jgi:hypothetical protein
MVAYNCFSFASEISEPPVETSAPAAVRRTLPVMVTVSPGRVNGRRVDKALIVNHTAAQQDDFLREGNLFDRRIVERVPDFFTFNVKKPVHFPALCTAQFLKR